MKIDQEMFADTIRSEGATEDLIEVLYEMYKALDEIAEHVEESDGVTALKALFKVQKHFLGDDYIPHPEGWDRDDFDWEEYLNGF